MIIRKIKLTEYEYQPPINYVAGATEPDIQFQLADYTIPAGATARCYVQRFNGTFEYTVATIDGNTVTVEPTSSMFSVRGEGAIQITLYAGEEVLKNFSVPVFVHVDLADENAEQGSDVTGIFRAAEEQALEEFQEQAEQIAENVIESIPEDYTALTEEVTELNERLTAIEESDIGISDALKQALLQLASKVAYIDEDGQDYYNDLFDALYAITAIALNVYSISFTSLEDTYQLIATTVPEGGEVSWSSSNETIVTVSDDGLVTSVDYGSATITATAGSISVTCSVLIAEATVTSISAVYTQSGTVYTSDSLDELKDDLVVTASWSDSSQTTLEDGDYTLSGTLEAGSSTITVSYGGTTTTFVVTVTADPWTLLYTLTENDMTLCGGNKQVYQSLTDGYYVTGNTRIAYTDFDLTIAGGKKYKAEKGPLTQRMGLELENEGTATRVANHQQIYRTDSGWITDSEYEFRNSVFAEYESIRPVASISSGQAMTFDNFDYIKIYAQDEYLTALDNSVWKRGYISSSNKISDATGSVNNGEMYTSIPISVTPGKTYRFSNSASEWTTTWVSYSFIKSDLKTFSSRNTVSSSASYVEFTVPDDYAFVVISSRNLYTSNYYQTATFAEVTG